MKKNFSNSEVKDVLRKAGSLNQLVVNSSPPTTTNEVQKKRGRPKKNEIDEDLIAVTFLLYKQQIKAIKALAHTNRLTIKDFFIQLVGTYLVERTDEIKKSLKIYNEDKEMQKVKLEKFKDILDDE